MPEPLKVAKAIGQATGATVQVHGAEAARQFGLTTQMPTQAIYNTTGASKLIKVGGTEVRLRHVSPRKLALAGRPAGIALAALWYLGKESVTPKVIEQVHSKLPENEFNVIESSTNLMPGWLSDAFIAWRIHLMAEEFLHLEPEERSQILRGLAPLLQRSAAVLEKDVWVCWVLQTLFALPSRLPMAFKGGTSLSKVFGLIDRFSEDVDVTIDYRGLDESTDPFAQGISRNKLKQLGERLKADVRKHVHHEVVPYFTQQLASQFNPESHQITVDDAGEKLRVYYPSAIESDDYLKDSVLLEFGGRNIIEPNEQHIIRPDIAPHLTELAFPEASVNVLSPARTFWEKTTLIHVECNRNEFRPNPERLSRHWYDLAVLAVSKVGETALEDMSLLEDVIRIKQAFFSSSTANYDDCLKGNFRLLPHQTALDALRRDYQQMINAGMFIGAPLAFTQIVERIDSLEKSINSILAK